MKPYYLSCRLQFLGKQSMRQRLTGKKYIGYLCFSPYLRRERRTQARLSRGRNEALVLSEEATQLTCGELWRWDGSSLLS